MLSICALCCGYLIIWTRIKLSKEWNIIKYCLIARKCCAISFFGWWMHGMLIHSNNEFFSKWMKNYYFNLIQTDFDWLRHLITLTLITSFNKTPLFNNSLIIHSFVHSINIIPADLWSYQLFFFVLHYLSQAKKTHLNTIYKQFNWNYCWHSIMTEQMPLLTRII